MNTLELALYLLVVCVYVCASCNSAMSVNLSITFTDMVVKTKWIHDDCFNGVLSNIKFHADYTYADKMFCMHNPNPLIPVEWTADVQALVRYGDNARETYAECIQNRTCDNINMHDWKQLAREQYTACRYCNDSNDNETCSDYYTVTQQDSVLAMVNTMYLVVQYTCTLEANAGNHVLLAYVEENNKQEVSTIKVPKDLVKCAAHELLQVKHITEQAVDYRLRVRDDNTDLVGSIQRTLNDVPLREYIDIPDSQWTVQGGYYWGRETNNTSKVNPFCVILHYECIKLVADIMFSRNATTSTQRTVRGTSIDTRGFPNQPLLTVIASSVVLCILTATVFALTLTIRNIRRHNQQQMA